MTEPLTALRMALRAAMVEQAVSELGMSEADALALVQRLTQDGTVGTQAASLASMMQSVQTAMIRNHALAIMMWETESRAAQDTEALQTEQARLQALNPCLVLTAGGTRVN